MRRIIFIVICMFGAIILWKYWLPSTKFEIPIISKIYPDCKDNSCIKDKITTMVSTASTTSNLKVAKSVQTLEKYIGSISSYGNALVNSAISLVNGTSSAPSSDKDIVKIISPTPSSNLDMEARYRIAWMGEVGNTYNVTLENQDGTKIGQIASGVTGGNFDWNVGKVISSGTNTETIVPPGEYKIVLSNSEANTDLSDKYSVPFVILPKPLVVSSLIPTSVSNDFDSFIVIYGNGFDNTTRVQSDIFGSSRSSKPLYVSPNGKILVFNISSGVNPSRYSIGVYNTNTIGVMSTSSNSISLTVSASQY